MQTSYLRSFLPCANLTCGGGLKVSVCDAGHRGFQRQLRRQHRHHPQLRVGPLSPHSRLTWTRFLAMCFIQQCFCLRSLRYLQPIHERGGIQSDDGSVCHHCPHLHSKCNRILPGDFCSLNITRWHQPIEYLCLVSSDYLNSSCPLLDDIFPSDHAWRATPSDKGSDGKILGR